MAEPVIRPVRAPFRAIARTVVPEAARLDDAGWSELERIVEHALAARPARVRRQIALLIRAVEFAPILRYGRRFTALDDAGRATVLAWFQGSRLLLLRRGVWGIRTLVFMGYYARPAAASEIGYRADPRGWEARR